MAERRSRRRTAPGTWRTSATGTRAQRRGASPRVRRRRRMIVMVMASLAIVAFLFVFVYPTRTYIEQRQQIARAEERLEVIRRETEELRRATERLEGDTEVERIAREQYGLVRPGETPYVIVPQTTPTTTPPPTEP